MTKPTHDQIFDLIAEHMETMLQTMVPEERHDEALELACEIAHTFSGSVCSFVAHEEQPKAPTVKEIDRALFNVTNKAVGDGANLDAILAALETQFVFWWATICPSCRAEAARALEHNIPRMLAAANQNPEGGAEEDCGEHRKVH